VNEFHGTSLLDSYEHSSNEEIGSFALFCSELHVAPEAWQDNFRPSTCCLLRRKRRNQSATSQSNPEEERDEDIVVKD
jgi:hypothetical protein